MAAHRTGVFALAVLLASAWAAPALAHPHVWIAMRSSVVFTNDGLIKGVNLNWSFDDGYAQVALDGLDTNGDGVYSEDELAPLAKENIANLKDYGFFTVMRLAGEKQEIGEVTEYGQVWSNGKLALNFHVPLKTPVDPRKGEFAVKIYDPDFYIAMDYETNDPVTVIGSMPATCKLLVKPLPTDAELEQTRTMLSAKGKDWQPETSEDFGAMFAQPVSIACGP
ncbi:MAG: DUF1007 family protein [Rhizobiales bacterium]|nr:DUF1007 family protein [Hyphomicrobiales bacterium]